MAQKTRPILKEFFQTGDIPTEGQYVDLIDSGLNLAENNTGDIQLTGNITASGNISSSSTLIANEVNVIGNITASNISASGTIIADSFKSTGENVNGISFVDDLNITGDITASGNISASGEIITSKVIVGKQGATSNEKLFSVSEDGEEKFSVDEDGDVDVLRRLSIIEGDIRISGSGTSVKAIYRDSSITTDALAFGTNGNFGTIIRGDHVTLAPTDSFVTASSGISSSGNFIVNDITASGNISSSLTGSFGRIIAGNITSSGVIAASQGRFPSRLITDNIHEFTVGNGIRILHNITASGDDTGNISASGNIDATNLRAGASLQVSSKRITLSSWAHENGGDFVFNDTGLNVEGGSITGSNISASGNISANSATVQGGLEVAMGGTNTDGIRILGGGGGIQAFLTNINGLRLQPTTQDPSQPDTPHVTIGVGGHITASGDISASGDIIANNINQSVKTTNSPTFASLILSDIAIDYRPTRDISGSLAYDATQTFNMGPKYGARLTVTGMPNVGADQLVTGIVVKNERVREHTIILANSNSAFTVQPFGIKSGQFVLNLRTGFKEYTASDFPSGFVINIALFGV